MDWLWLIAPFVPLAMLLGVFVWLWWNDTALF